MDSRENNCLCLNLAIHYYSLPSSFPQTLKKFERMTLFNGNFRGFCSKAMNYDDLCNI